MNVIGDEELVLLPLLPLEGEGHLHGLSGSSALIKQTSASHGETGEVGHEGLEVEKHLR